MQHQIIVRVCVFFLLLLGARHTNDGRRRLCKDCAHLLQFFGFEGQSNWIIIGLLDDDGYMPILFDDFAVRCHVSVARRTLTSI